MTDSEFDRLTKALRNGDEQLLDHLFLDQFQYCTEYLVREFNTGGNRCTPDDAKDVFMDGLLKLRNILLRSEVENRNLRGYLITTCRNIWLKKIQRNKPNLPLDIEKAEYYLGKQEGLYDEAFNPLIKKENAGEVSEEQARRLDIFTKAWQQLGEKCRELLQAFYLDGFKLKDLQERFGYSSYDSIKSMRRKCFNALKKRKDELI